MADTVRSLILTWHDSHQGVRCCCVLAHMPANVWDGLDPDDRADLARYVKLDTWNLVTGTEAREGTARYRAVVAGPDYRGEAPPTPVRVLHLPDIEPVGPHAELYWLRATPLEEVRRRG